MQGKAVGINKRTAHGHLNHLKIDGRAAVVLPDNVLFEGGAGEKVRKNLLEKCNVHTLLRLPAGIWYSPGVKAKTWSSSTRKRPAPKAWTKELWVYDLRTNKHFFQKQRPNTRADFGEFADCYKSGSIHKRKEIWSEANPDGCWRRYSYDDILKRDKLSPRSLLAQRQEPHGRNACFPPPRHPRHRDRR